MNIVRNNKVINFFVIQNIIIYAFISALFFKGGVTFAENLPLLVLKNGGMPTINKITQAAAQPLVTAQEIIKDPPKRNNFPWGQCTWYVASKRNVTWNGHARSWYHNAKKAGRKVGNIPLIGSIVVLNQGYYGHVGFVESVSRDTFTFSESNNPIPGKITTKTISKNDSKIIGFIY